MRRPALLFLILTGVLNVALSQTPLLKNPSLLELESILAEYGDVGTERVQLDLEQGTVVILEISYSALPQTVMTAYASDGPIMLFGYFSQEDISPRRFLASSEALEQELWTFEEDGDGDLSYKAYMDVESREALEEDAVMLVVSLQMITEPFLGSLAATAESEELFDVAACERAIAQSIVGMPEQVRSEVNPMEYCQCIGKRVEDDPSLGSALLNPSSPKGTDLMKSCWDTYIPRWRELGLTFEAVMGEVNVEEMEDQVRNTFVRSCVEAMAADPSWGTSDIGYGQADAFCRCAFDEVVDREDLSLEDFNDMNSDVLVELRAGCIEELGFGSPAGWNSDLRAQGCVGEQRIPTLWNGAGYQIRLTLGQTSKYILLDSGASEVIIDQRWYDELRSEGSIRPGDYEGVEYVEIADGSTASMDRYRVSSLTIGECVFRDFSIGVMKEGGMMCGMGLLGLFDSWTMDTRNSELILRN
jgi:hypothetical protein